MTETEQIADIVVAAVRASTGPMAGDMAALHTRMAALETKHAAMCDQMAGCQSDMQDCIGQMKALAAKVDAMPMPAAGKDGADGINGKDGADGRDGLPGVPGRDGAPGERGQAGQDGARGADGTLEGCSLEQLDDRSWRIVRADGTPLAGVLGLSVPLYRGVFVAGTAYVKGDAVTYSGSLWIAKAPTSDKPGDGATAWQLAVKAGRDGKSITGERGPQGPQGPRGEAGRDYR